VINQIAKKKTTKIPQQGFDGFKSAKVRNSEKALLACLLA
jgi:hypothetical protein